MEYRTLGKSNIKVSALAFGAWDIGRWIWNNADFNISGGEINRINGLLSTVELEKVILRKR